MCIPPFGEDSSKFFSEMRKLNETIDLSELSMGMSSDYLNAVDHKSTYLRIGSSIFGNRDQFNMNCVFLLINFNNIIKSFLLKATHPAVG